MNNLNQYNLDSNKNIGLFIKQNRKKIKLSLKDLALFLDISPQQLHKYEQGKSTLSLINFQKLLDVFEKKGSILKSKSVINYNSLEDVSLNQNNYQNTINDNTSILNDQLNQAYGLEANIKKNVDEFSLDSDIASIIKNLNYNQKQKVLLFLKNFI